MEAAPEGCAGPWDDALDRAKRAVAVRNIEPFIAAVTRLLAVDDTAGVNPHAPPLVRDTFLTAPSVSITR